MKPYYQDDSCTIYHSDCLQALGELEECSINTCVTSPPYWGLRDYEASGQIGLEETIEEYISKMVCVFREVNRVLRKDGTLWLNIGDSYASGGRGGGGAFMDMRSNGAWKGRSLATCWHSPTDGLKHKDLCMVPARVALALQTDGWILRQDIVWNKTNPMPESVRDRCTKSHEYIFLMAKSPKYYYDIESMKEPVTGGAHSRGNGVNPKSRNTGVGWGYSEGKRSKPRYKQAVSDLVEMRNKRSVWTLPTQAFSGAHFATFPEDLIKPCILAGCPKEGVVLDPFCGSGTTLRVAKDLGRNSIGLEINKDYADITIKRLSQEVLAL